MKYALNLAEDNRILSATFEQYAHADALFVEDDNTEHTDVISAIHSGKLPDYRYESGKFIYAPLPEPEPVAPEPTQLDIIEAQVTYTAMMTDTLLESEV